MANPILFGVDLSTYTLSATSTNASFPLTNLQTYYASDLWKTPINFASPFNLTIDFGVATTCDTLVLDTYDFGNADTGYPRLQGASDSGFTANLVTYLSGSINPQSPPGVTQSYFTFTSTSRRYWRLNILNAGAPNGLAMSIGNIFLGKRFDFGFPYDFGYEDGGTEYKTTKLRALDGTLRTAQTYGGVKKWKINYAGNNGGISDTTKTNWRTLWSTVRGELRPFYYLDTDGTTLSYVQFAMNRDQSRRDMVNINNLEGVLMESQLTF